MRKKQYKLVKLYTQLIAAIVLALSSSFLSQGTASASSAYDNAVQLTESLIVARSNSSIPIDVTHTWYQYIVSASGSCTSGTKMSLQKALDHGSLAVNQELNNNSSTDYRRVQVSWSESATIPGMVWFMDASATVTFPSIYPGPPNMGGAILYMNSDGNIQVMCSLSAFASAWSNAAGTARGFFATNPPDYPAGYEGLPIPTTHQGAVISGNVQCANTNNIISNIFIETQSSVDGDAILTDDGMGGKNYRFYLWDESPYSLVVICDGDPFYGPTVSADLYNTHNWVCATTGDENVCAAS